MEVRQAILFLIHLLTSSTGAQFCNETSGPAKFFAFQERPDGVSFIGVNFEAAIGHCEELGATLARISSEKDFLSASEAIQDVAPFANIPGIGFWIGLRDNTGEDILEGSTDTSRFTFVEGEEFGTSFFEVPGSFPWNTTEPNNQQAVTLSMNTKLVKMRTTAADLNMNTARQMAQKVLLRLQQLTMSSFPIVAYASTVGTLFILLGITVLRYQQRLKSDRAENSAITIEYVDITRQNYI